MKKGWCLANNRSPSFPPYTVVLHVSVYFVLCQNGYAKGQPSHWTWVEVLSWWPELMRFDCLITGLPRETVKHTPTFLTGWLVYFMIHLLDGFIQKVKLTF